MDVKDKISYIPHSPGVYIYYDSGENIIYVGKAKDLHKRVSQYFSCEDKLSLKTRLLVSKIANIKYLVVNSESDALLLENNLIKQYKPKYNILLKDSKTYPWICISSEPFPKVFLTRRLEKNKNLYFGPYGSMMHAKKLMKMIEELYPLRTCSLKITEKAVSQNKFRPCLKMHIHKCEGCCVGKVAPEKYGKYIDEIITLLKGGAGSLIRHYKKQMTEYSENLEFEKAEECKQRIFVLENHYGKSIIHNAGLNDLDVFSLLIEKSDAFGNFMRIRGGAIVSSMNLMFKLNIEEDSSSVLSEFIMEIKNKFGDLSKEVLVPFFPDVDFSEAEFKIPVKGDKLSILELSIKNAKQLKIETFSRREKNDPEKYARTVLLELKNILGMKELPVHIECFDNSNLQGTNPVSSCVVFKNAVPSKKDYRKFKVMTVEGPDDYATMKEVIKRRYSKVQAEQGKLPQLIVIDGGRGQLESALSVLDELGLSDKLEIIGLAKRLEEVIRKDDPHPLFIDRNSKALNLLKHIRDEAHRFGITYHRQLRSKNQIHSVLRDIKGVGEKTEQRLLIHYGSVSRIAEVSKEDLILFLGNKTLASRISDALSTKNNDL